MQQDANDALTTLDRAFQAAMDHHRALMEGAALFLRDESFRFINLRIDRTRDAMDQLAECRDLPGVMMVQKEWLGDLVQDCAAQGQRYSELWSQGAGRVRAEMERQAENAQAAAQAMMDEATGAAAQTADKAQEAAQDVAEEAGEAFTEAQEAMTPGFQPQNSHNDQYH